MGKYLFERAMELKENHPCVGDVRGLGLLVGLELVKNRKTKEPITAVNAKVRKGMNPKLEMVKKLGELGMMTMAANPSNVVVMAPPLIVTKDEIDEGISKMDQVLSIGDALTES
jgi:taurine--2-oxoglutarate transaminase